MMWSTEFLEVEDIIATMSKRSFSPVVSNDLDQTIPKPDRRTQKERIYIQGYQ